MVTLKQIESQLRKFAMEYPETVEEFPWGHSAFKVKKKIFLFMAMEKGELSLSTKLPKSSKKALKNSFASPTRYGLGPSGWVTSLFNKKDRVPLDLLTDWIDESFRAIAPKKIVAYLDMDDDEPAALIRKAKK